MNNPWYGLEERLRGIAQYNNYGKRTSGKQGVVLVQIKLLFNNNELVGWYKPFRTEIEPYSFDVSNLITEQRRLDGWKDTLSRLEDSIEDDRVDKTLVILDGQPVGFL